MSRTYWDTEKSTRRCITIQALKNTRESQALPKLRGITVYFRIKHLQRGQLILPLQWIRNIISQIICLAIHRLKMEHCSCKIKVEQAQQRTPEPEVQLHSGRWIEPLVTMSLYHPLICHPRMWRLSHNSRKIWILMRDLHSHSMVRSNIKFLIKKSPVNIGKGFLSCLMSMLKRDRS